VNRARAADFVVKMRFGVLAALLMLLLVPFAIGADVPTEIDLTTLPHPSIGPENGARAVVIEFSDFECPNCRRIEPELEQLRRIYGNEMRFVWFDFPLDAHHHAMLAAEAARCAGEQGQFWPYHDALMSGRESLGERNLADLAARLGLDSAKFDSCVATHKYEGMVESDIDKGNSIGISGTPTIFINGSEYTGGQSLDDLKSAIDRAAGRTSSPHASVQNLSNAAPRDQQ
jgi:protein-disulfide isomerase